MLPSCLVCGFKITQYLCESKDFFILKGKSDEFLLFRCLGCSVIFTFPELEPREINRFYPDFYEAYVIRNNSEKILMKFKYYYDIVFIEKLLAKFKLNRKIFEIGSGRGEFLNALKQRGFEVSGTEPSAIGCNQAKQLFDLDLICGSAENIIFKEKFPVITGRHVFEHLISPYQFLLNVKSSGLTENGFLILKLPNIDSWEYKIFGSYWHGLDLPRHRYHFTKKSISHILISSGFSNIKIRYELVPLDFIRSVENFLNFSNHRSTKILKVFIKLPKWLKFTLASVIVVTLSTFKPGRMVVIAQNKVSQVLDSIY